MQGKTFSTILEKFYTQREMLLETIIEYTSMNREKVTNTFNDYLRAESKTYSAIREFEEHGAEAFLYAYHTHSFQAFHRTKNKLHPLNKDEDK